MSFLAVNYGYPPWPDTHSSQLTLFLILAAKIEQYALILFLTCLIGGVCERVKKRRKGRNGLAHAKFVKLNHKHYAPKKNPFSIPTFSNLPHLKFCGISIIKFFVCYNLCTKNRV